ncbi:IS66 family transposase [Archangium sp.]|uniref:IS66 family transposase n=1 Tax=Archangium sp. TaxID=1872627 RepID=UPI002D3C5569|nr:transposase [Archangium sp.]HYO57719.1 transposase [Archangium sp.]
MRFQLETEKDMARLRQAALLPKEAPPSHGHGPRAQPTLPTLEVVYTLEEPDKQCPKCGGALNEMKGCYEDAEEVDVVERRFVLRRHKRQKYRCSCDGCVETALGPPKLQPGGRYSVDFAVEVAAAKYLDHLPLKRQVRVMAREGLVVDSQTLWSQIDALAQLLAPAHEALHAALLTREILGGEKLAGLIESTFGFTRLSNEVLFTPVPDLVPRTANHGLGKAQLIDCLFTWHRW